MKIRPLIVFSFILLNVIYQFAYGESNTLSWKGTEGSQDTPLNKFLFSELSEENNTLKKVKYYLLNGEVDLAKVRLNGLIYSQTKLKPLVMRYLAILHFIDGDFTKSLKYLQAKELKDPANYKKVCSLTVINLVALNKVSTLHDEWEKCKIESYSALDKNSIVWLDMLVEMKTKPREGLTRKPFRNMKLAMLENEQLKTILKLALFLNQEKIVMDQLNELTESQIQDPEARELVGHILFRQGALAKSYRFIEDLNTPNAENIKGNIYILRNKYELAYAQFKLALARKENSQNAMERILPLAWLLGDWIEGARISQMVIATPQNQINKMTLASAFWAQKGDYEKSKEFLDRISGRSKKGSELDVTQLHSFVGLMLNDEFLVKKQSATSCAQFDLVNCWLSYQMVQWDTFPLTSRRDEKLPFKKEWEKLTTEELDQPLKETAYVNQLDIEELDNKLIQLVPNAK